MLGLEPLEIGLIFWAGNDVRANIREVKQFGLRAGQIGIPSDLAIDGAAEVWDRALTEEHFIAVALVCSFEGENYADIPSVARTVGLVPPSTRSERVARIKAVSAFGRQLGIDCLACHVGVIPPDHVERSYAEIIDVAREVCDACQINGQSFALETGQEPAKVLLHFMEDVDRANLKINFDPANMILYGTGDPLDAFDVLAKRVISVHCKDGDWPDRAHPDALGEEVPLGKGKVDIPAFVAKLKSARYTGPLIIEREQGDPGQRTAEIRDAIQLLRNLSLPQPELTTGH